MLETNSISCKEALSAPDRVSGVGAATDMRAPSFLSDNGPAVSVVPLDLVITTLEFDDTLLFLPAKELEAVRRSALAIC